MPSEGLFSSEEINNKKNDFKKYLEKEFVASKNYKSDLKWYDGTWSRFKPELGKDKRGVSGVNKNKIIEIGKKITTIPENFFIHKTLKKIFENKHKMFSENYPIDWATAETLAFGTLLEEGFSVRLIRSRFWKRNF